MRVVTLIILGIFCAFAQIFAVNYHSQDSCLTIDEIVIRSTRLCDFAIGNPVQTIDSSVLKYYHNQSLSELLSEQTAISVNTYGPGGLATISSRGGGSDHTAVIWNGFNLRDPMNAGLNFSSLPVSLFDNLTVQYGGTSTLFGSGATTSSIHLNNTLNFNRGFSAMIGTLGGSFKTYNQSLSINYSTKKFATATRFFYQEGANDFKFINTEKFDNPTERLQHAGYSGYAIMQQNAFKISNYSVIRSDIWYQKFYKNIPSLMSNMEPGKTNQLDENLRMALSSAYSADKILFYARSGLFYNKTDYKDPVLYPEGAISKSFSNINELEAKYLVSSNHNINAGINYTFESAQADNYQNHPERQRVSFFASYLFLSSNHKLSTVVNVRQEIVDGSFIPIVFSGGTDYELLHHLHLKINASKNYMLPTFNNLYWARDAYSEGNPNLKPESGYSYEGGLLLLSDIGQINLSTEITGYNSIINNWIIWSTDSIGIYRPENFSHGKTNGIELRGSAEINSAHFKHKLIYLYTFVYARVEDYDVSDSSLKMKQLFYVPKNKASLSYSLFFHQFSLTTSLAYYGERYYDYLKEPLASYMLVGLSVERNFYIKNYSLEMYLKVNNITNTKYQVMAGYAMPPINILIGMNLRFSK